ncbi:polysaccharide deacetylase family protein [Tateyamaria sp.]|uniref:polysaccharide deacetylase family protein n=1 Tax=Tateyamaria sp. TaxID=1929288 RepID=UPI00329C277C
MTTDWSLLRAALSACRRDAVAVPLWWRDDDAIAPTAALDQLSRLSIQTGLPIHLAVIPAHADPALVHAIDTRQIIPVVHGWTHMDHSGGLGKKNEFLTKRADASTDAARGLTQMQALFGAKLRTMFVPPWNRINTAVTAALPGQGYTTLSTFGARTSPNAVPGLAQINTHIDPIWWKDTRDLVDPAALITQATQHLEARRTGVQDPTEPFGLLTHHLVHTDAIWNFSSAFVTEMLDGGATPWTMEKTT